MDLRNHSRGTTLVLSLGLLLTMGCAHQRYDAHGNPYYEPYEHRHATEGAILGGLAGAGVGRAIAGRHHDEAGYWIGGALGAITGAVIGDTMDRQKAQRAHPYPESYPEPHGDPYPGPYDPRRDGHRDDEWDDWEDDWDEGAYAPPSRDPQFLNLPDEVLFSEGSAELERGAERRLRAVAKALRRHPGTQAVVRGHASRVETSRSALSDARARTVRSYLLRQGLAPSRVVALGMGARFPVATDRTAEGRQRNRRAEIEIHSDRGAELARLR